MRVAKRCLVAVDLDVEGPVARREFQGVGLFRPSQ